MNPGPRRKGLPTMRKLFSCLFCGAALVWMTCFCGDLLRFINNEVPMFSVEWRAAENYREYLGFGYKIGIYREPDGLRAVFGGPWARLDGEMQPDKPPRLENGFAV